MKGTTDISKALSELFIPEADHPVFLTTNVPDNCLYVCHSTLIHADDKHSTLHGAPCRHLPVVRISKSTRPRSHSANAFVLTLAVSKGPRKDAHLALIVLVLQSEWV